MTHHLNGLAVERKLAFGGLLEIVARRPAGTRLAGSQMEVTTESPHACSFLLGLIQASLQAGTHASQHQDANGFHRPLLLK